MPPISKWDRSKVLLSQVDSTDLALYNRSQQLLSWTYIMNFLQRAAYITCKSIPGSPELEPVVAELLEATFHCNYPHIQISRPSRFFNTVKRIAAPTRPSAIGHRKLNGSPLRSYLKRHWKPRIRNTQQGVLHI